MLPPGTVLFTSRAGIGKTAILTQKGCTNQGFQSIVPHRGELDSYFVFSRTEELKRYGELVGAGSTFVEVSGKQMAAMELMMPSTMREQQTIGGFFRHLDNLITLHQRKYDKLQVLKKAMLEKMFPKNGSSVPEIRFKGFTDAWEQRKLGDNIVEYTEVTTENNQYPPLTSSRKGIFLQTEYFAGNQIASDDNTGYNIVPYGYFTYRHMSDDEVFHFNINDIVEKGIVSTLYPVFTTDENLDSRYLQYQLNYGHEFAKFAILQKQGGSRTYMYLNKLRQLHLTMPNHVEEQKAISSFFMNLDHLITLHQRKPYSHIHRRCNMLNEAQRTDKFCEYYAKWITVYKKGAIRQVTMDKYLMTQKWLEKLIPDLKICDLNRIAYQQLLNDYAEYHERQTTMDFHHQLKGAVLDAVDEGLIDRDPTRKAIIKGKAPSTKKIKYLNQFELHTLLASLELKDEVNWDYFILLVAKTGMRFSEALALTPKDFDFYHQTLSISKTWDYKGAGGFQPTKNKSSVRKIQIDWQSVIRFSELVKGLPDDHPIFVDGKVYNSTVNDVLSRHCERCNIPVISIHGLRHTHASLLLFTGVSIASVARRLGHSSMTTTQKTYLHIIQELENKDIDLVMRSLSGLN